ncbi:membrane-associated lipoprotein involved in thiamine biosynthesis [Owenweeksia hongkongensis DSM 17368]|uniref:FAD:protein FMN transferase n=1 Tax=Owenweeksia hongkongensis (strain DSM 17368 / CIP 108786 / JCM 12287 / NRRL B-23963 / UST20020801) TaxID=926562 RepID=G8R4G4_OWEHD|nr:FAD:protein FMN transferase [Owenweeksia hongkongensis]AEV32053.1 membrane-associated lipoprotein involved in thiamine biosynthesis [Owenweeksia hongkongensis DSM 17368]
MKKIVLAIIGLALVGCRAETIIYENESVGYAQGSTYQIKYITESQQDWTAQFDSIFEYIDQSMSTYKDESLISLINSGDTLVEVDHLFMEVLKRSSEISRESDGLFDVTVGPLVELWGFGKTKNIDIDSSKVDSAKSLIGYKQIVVQNNSVKVPQGFKIDFNSIAQGYTVDVVARFLEDNGVNQYMVEVGGEVRAKGKNSKDHYWKIGVDKPADEIDPEDRFQMIVELRDKSLATSGNYRKYWVDSETGIKYAHTINPKTGFPARNQLLSVSIIADKCIDADAYATTCMVMGMQAAQSYIEGKDGVEAYFISTDENGDWKVNFTKGFEAFILN